MSFIKARGQAAAEAANKEKPQYEKLLKTFKTGDTYKVRVATAYDYVMYEAHGLYVKGGQGIFTTPCVHGSDCPYCKGVNELYKEFNTKGDEEKKGMANQLKKKERYFMGFVNLDDNSPIILDFSKKQAKALIATIQKNEKKLKKSPFEISKSGSGQATIVSLERIDEEDLNENQLKNFEASEGFVFEDEMFEVIQEKSIDEGIEDLKKIGIDFSSPVQAADEKVLEKIEEETEDIFGNEFEM